MRNVHKRSVVFQLIEFGLGILGTVVTLMSSTSLAVKAIGVVLIIVLASIGVMIIRAVERFYSR